MSIAAIFIIIIILIVLVIVGLNLYNKQKGTNNGFVDSSPPVTTQAQQQSNLANVLRGTQMPQSLLPSIYKQQNPFNFGQQETPVQDVSALAKLLRTA